MNALTRKVGPLPVWAWALIVAVVGYVVYKRFAQTGSSGATVPVGASQPATDSSGSLGLTTTAGSPADTGQTTSDLVSALGGQQASLLSALEAQSQDVLALAQSQINAVQTQTSLGSFQTETQPVATTIPGTGNAPAISYVNPTVANTTSTPTGAIATVTSAVTKPLRYYTYRAQVPLAHGQSIHFTSGRGYYAA